MSKETETGLAAGEPTLESWQAAVVGGIVGAIVMGGMMAMQMANVLEMAIPAMYGISGPAGAVGFTIHVAHGAVLGVGFAALADRVGAGEYTRAVGLGLGYGVALWVVAAGIVMPVWLSAVGFGNAPPVPNLSTTSLVAHAVYGAVLGAVYAALR